jgi:diguanylate cyclase (GGDEF)-like protein
MKSIFQQINHSPNADHWHRFRCSADRLIEIAKAAPLSGFRVETHELADLSDPLVVMRDKNDVLCVAEPSPFSPSPFEQFADPYSVAFTDDPDAVREALRWMERSVAETPPVEAVNDDRSSHLLSVLREQERLSWLELECFVLRATQSFNQLEMEGEPLFLSLTRIIQELLAPDLLELEMPKPSEFWPGQAIGWAWRQSVQEDYTIPAALTARLQRLLYRRERVLFIEDLASAPDVQLADQPRDRRFRSAFLMPLIVGTQTLGIMKLLYTQTLCPLAGEVEAVEMLRRELSVYLDRTRTRLSMQRMAMVDGLTNLFNHRFFHEQLRTEFQRAVRYQKAMALLMIDIDDFKGYNDTYGHLAGDRVLAETARTIRGVVRDIDFVARYGGEEFALILPEVDAQSGIIVAEKIRSAVEALRFISEDGEAIGSITVSCGVTDNREAVAPDALIERADRALYWVKRHGRNLVRLASENDHE